MPATKNRPTATGWIIAAVCAAAYLAYQWVTAHPVLATLAALGLATAGILLGVLRARGRLRRIRHKAMAADPQHMSPTEFEEYLADLCIRDGCSRVRVVGGANDHGADVLYTDPYGQPGVIQAKRYAPGNSVGNEAVQIVNGTYRDAHGCAHAAIVTTSHFTDPARQYAKRVGIALLDSQRLDEWAYGNLDAAPWN